MFRIVQINLSAVSLPVLTAAMLPVLVIAGVSTTLTLASVGAALSTVLGVITIIDQIVEGVKD